MKVSCIVPVYNEAKRVSAVLDALIHHEMIDEIIVVNDGSTDDSELLLKEIKGIKFITYTKNKGKTQALKRGLQEAKNEWIMTIDSDLLGLTQADITALVNPIHDQDLHMTMSLRKNSLSLFKLFGLDFISGERVFKKSLIPDLDQLDRLPKFGFEVFLNDLLIAQKGSLGVVDWKEVVTPRKSVKFGFYAGYKADVKMFFELVAVIGMTGMLRQLLKMRALMKK